METLLYVELNVFAFIILLLIYINLRHQTEKYLIEQKLFLLLISLNAVILICDSFMWILDGKIGQFFKIAYLVSTTGYYIFSPLVCMMWSLYADYLVNRNEKHLKRMIIPFLLPFLINTILSIMSLFNHQLFYIDQNNIYHRGTLFPVMGIICYLYLVYTFIYILRKRPNIEKRSFYPIVLFSVPPFLGGILQFAFYGVSLIWLCTTVSILIIFIDIQNNQLYKDYLTDLFNRRQLDTYLKSRIPRGSSKKLLAGIMIDLDSFKMINDVYGHVVGDEALQYTSQILKESFRKNDFIARYGGDEFVIIVEVADSSELIKAVHRLKENLNTFNSKKIVPYHIDFSIGVDYYNPHSTKSAQDFLKRIDSLMYLDKKEKENHKE